jgi:hypothetical protein
LKDGGHGWVSLAESGPAGDRTQDGRM